jgi:hypothetical protein
VTVRPEKSEPPTAAGTTPSTLNSVRQRSVTSLRHKLIKIGAKIAAHSRYVLFHMAEVAVPRELFARILERIQWFGVPPPLVQMGMKAC